MSEKPAHPVERAIQFVDANIIDADRVFILDAIFGHGSFVPYSIEGKNVAALPFGGLEGRVWLSETPTLS
jgi:hypothetical protein